MQEGQPPADGLGPAPLGSLPLHPPGHDDPHPNRHEELSDFPQPHEGLAVPDDHAGGSQDHNPHGRQDASFKAVTDAGVDDGHQIEGYGDVMDAAEGATHLVGFKAIVDGGDGQNEGLNQPEVPFPQASGEVAGELQQV